ncbi:TPA: cell surface protein, partial [Streptococcus suis]|nr:cell surface protein [Streptococcus suis]
MSKQKVVSSLLLSTVVLGGLAFYSTTTVKAESLETDVTSVSSGDVVEKPVVSNEEGGDFLAEEEEFEDDVASEEELNEKAEEVTESSSSEALLQPRAMMSDSGSNHTEEIPVDDSVSVSEKIADTPLIQTTNADSTNYKDSVEKEKFQKSVTIDSVKLEEKQITWRVNFDTSEWSFDRHNGGIYFILPQGLKLTSIKGNGETELFSQFPKEVKSSNNNSGAPYRFFDREENIDYDRNFDNQWSWSAGQAPNETINSWKTGNRLSKIYFIDNIQATTRLTYALTASVTEPTLKSFPFVAVMKSFWYTNSWRTQVTSLAGREITLEKEKPLPPKETPKQDTPEAPNPDSGIILKPLPKPEVPQTPKEEAPKEEPKQEVPQEPKEQPKDTPEASPKQEEPQAEEPKKEEEPGQELPKPMEPKVDKPTPEVPKQEDVQPEAPKSDKAETDKPMPETKQPDMKQPKADDMPKEPKPKSDEPKAEQPQMDKPQMEAPKKDSEAPKSDKVETDKPMPETKQPDMKQPKADDMPKEQQPKSDEPKAEQPQMDKPQMEAPKKDSEAPKSDK